MGLRVLRSVTVKMVRGLCLSEPDELPTLNIGKGTGSVSKVLKHVCRSDGGLVSMKHFTQWHLVVKCEHFGQFGQDWWVHGVGWCGWCVTIAVFFVPVAVGTKHQAVESNMASGSLIMKQSQYFVCPSEIWLTCQCDSDKCTGKYKYVSEQTHCYLASNLVLGLSGHPASHPASHPPQTFDLSEMVNMKVQSPSLLRAYKGSWGPASCQVVWVSSCLSCLALHTACNGKWSDL